jgi:hypothetical protein
MIDINEKGKLKRKVNEGRQREMVGVQKVDNPFTSLKECSNR